MERMSTVVSDVIAAANTEEGASNAAEPFSFARLEALVAEHTQPGDEPLTSKWNRYTVVGALLFSALAVLSSLLLRNQLGLDILLVLFMLECLCLVAALASAFRQGWREYRHQHEGFARELDRQLVRYNVVIDVVRSYPSSVIATYLRYVRDRRSRLVYRAGLLSGGMDKLGLLPLLLGMYLQFKDWPSGNWKELLSHVHLLGNFLLMMLLATYLVSWWGARAKGRLDLYEIVLMEASLRSEQTCSDGF